MASALRDVKALVAEVFERVVIAPVRLGAPLPHLWPAPVRPPLVVAGLGWLVALLAAVFADQLRASDTQVLMADGSGSQTLGIVAFRALTAALVLVMALGLVGAIHAAWPVRWLAVLTTALVLTIFWPGWPLLSTVVGVVVVLAAWRGGRPVGWFEFPIALLACGAGVIAPMWGAPIATHTVVLAQALISIAAFAMPTYIAAGFAFAQLTVGLGRMLGQSARGASPVQLGAIALAGGLWWGWQAVAGTWWESGFAWQPAAWLRSAAVLAVGAGLVFFLAAGAPDDDPDAPGAAFGRWVYPLGVALVAPIFPALLVGALAQAAGGFGFAQAVADLQALQALIGAAAGVAALRIVLSVAALVGAVLLRPRRPIVAAVAGVFGWFGLLRAVSQLSGGRIPTAWTPETGSALLVMAGLLVLGVGMARGTAGGVLEPVVTLVAVATLYSWRLVIAEPAAWVAGSAVAVIVVGLVWNLLTTAGFTREESRAFPASSRLLLFAAVSVLAASLIAYVALSRGATSLFNLEPMFAVGDEWLGTPLAFAAMLLALGRAVREALRWAPANRKQPHEFPHREPENP